MTTYEKYQQMVIAAQNRGNPDSAIVTELRSEIKNIEAALRKKLIQLSGNKSPYPAREAKRRASECVMSIERLCDELLKEKVS